MQRNKKNVKSTKSTKNWTQSLDATIALVLVYLWIVYNLQSKEDQVGVRAICVCKFNKDYEFLARNRADSSL